MTETTYLIICVIALIIAGVILEIQSRQIKKLKKEIKKYQAKDKLNNNIPI